MAEPTPITRLLQQWQSGDAQSLEQLTPMVYQELRRLAGGLFRSERSNHTLQPTALVHEAFVRLIDANVGWQSRAHFYALAARQMRHILINHALARKSAKRGGGQAAIPLDDEVDASAAFDEQVVNLEAALVNLEKIQPRKAQLLELHYFGGLTYQEMAKVSELSETTVHNELRLAKAWLQRELEEGGHDTGAVVES